MVRSQSKFAYSPLTLGSLAARSAGNSPPIRPTFRDDRDNALIGADRLCTSELSALSAE
jgi:hypothetical protein